MCDARSISASRLFRTWPHYGPPAGLRRKENFRQDVCAEDLAGDNRDELIRVDLGHGYDMWPGPYGDGGSRKYLLASLDRS